MMRALLILALCALAASAATDLTPEGRNLLKYVCSCPNAANATECTELEDVPRVDWDMTYSLEPHSCDYACPCNTTCTNNGTATVTCSGLRVVGTGKVYAIDCSGSTHPHGATLAYEMTFGDMLNTLYSTTGVFSHVFTLAGDFEVTISAIDGCDNKGVASYQVLVVPPETGTCFDGMAEADNLTDCASPLCDGRVEEFYNGPGGTENVGECRAGVKRCLAGVELIDREEVVPAAEDRPGFDDTCDGTEGESENLDSDPNNCGTVGNVCTTGLECVAGQCNNGTQCGNLTGDFFYSPGIAGTGNQTVTFTAAVDVGTQAWNMSCTDASCGVCDAGAGAAAVFVGQYCCGAITNSTLGPVHLVYHQLHELDCVFEQWASLRRCCGDAVSCLGVPDVLVRGVGGLQP